jgi:purine/pyrimidine-nucleoside phosphorylase
MLKHNVYFEGKVQSIGFERNGRRQTAGVIDAGEFHFGTDAAERMTVVSGELSIKLDGSSEWKSYAAGTSFEVAAKSGFDVRVANPSAYLCEFL